MLVFNDSGVGDLPLCIIHHRISLIIIALRQILLFEGEGAILKIAKAIIKIFIDHAGIQHLVKSNIVFAVFSALLLFRKESTVLRVQQDLRPLKKLFHNPGIATYGNALISVIKIIVVIDKPEWQPFNNESRQFLTVSAPLLFRVPFDQFLIDIRPGKRQCLFLQILWLRDMQLLYLLLNLRLRLSRRFNPPELRKSIHIEGEIINLVLIYGNR